MVSRGGGLRQRKKEQTRQRIEDAAQRLFAQKGFEAVTINAIANEAEIAPRTFFHYFPTKEDVALADFARRLASLISEVDRRPHDEEPWAALRAGFVAVAADHEQQQLQLFQQFQVMAAAPSVQARSLQLQAECEDALAMSLARRQGSDSGDDLTARLLAASALGAMRSSLRHWLQSTHTATLPAVLQSCFDQLAAGLAESPRPER